jgi:hypothetical protein
MLALFVAVTAAGFSPMMAIDRPERMSTLAYMQCGDCSHGIGSPDRLQLDTNSNGRLQQILQSFSIPTKGVETIWRLYCAISGDGRAQPCQLPRLPARLACNFKAEVGGMPPAELT